MNIRKRSRTEMSRYINAVLQYGYWQEQMALAMDGELKAGWDGNADKKEYYNKQWNIYFHKSQVIYFWLIDQYGSL
jgi:hypothetical protein